jgi:hypothetical protein
MLAPSPWGAGVLGGAAMALDASKFVPDDVTRSLPTGFVYRRREDIEGFELRREVIDAMTARLSRLGTYHQRPSGPDFQAI